MSVVGWLYNRPFSFLLVCASVFDTRAHQWGRISSFTRFLDHTQRRIRVGRTPLDEWSIRRRDLYLTSHNNQNRKTSMPLVGFEHTISAGERPQICALDRAATWTNFCWLGDSNIFYPISVLVWNSIIYFMIWRVTVRLVCDDPDR